MKGKVLKVVLVVAIVIALVVSWNMFKGKPVVSGAPPVGGD